MSAAKHKSTGKGGRGAGSSGRAKPPSGGAGRGVAERAPASGSSSPSGASAKGRLARWAVWGIALVPPLLISATADDAFRLPKTLAAESLALLSLLAIAAGWWGRGSISLAELARRPATMFAGLLTAAMLPGAIFAVHPEHWRRAASSLAIALACIALWSARLSEKTLRRALDLLVLPAVALAVLAILQRFDVFRPFAFANDDVQRYQLTSLAGSVGDLAAFLILPSLVLQAALLRARSRAGRIVSGVVLALIAYTIFLSQTLAAVLAIAVATLVFWALVLPRRRWSLLAVPLIAVVLAAMLLPGISRRVGAKYREIKAGKYDSFLSGRPDGWKTSLEMFRDHPVFGVGHGGYGASFAPAKLALIERGVPFWGRGRTAFFANAHNDYLEALAEWGLWGAIALVAAVAILVRALHRLARDATDPAHLADRALAIAGCAACAVLALASFPLRIALTAYPWLLLVAWIFTRSSEGALAGPGGGGANDEPARAGVSVPARAWSAALVLLLVVTLAIHVLSLLGRLQASRIVRTTSHVAQLALGQGEAAARPVLQANLQPLRFAAQLDPLAIGVPLTTGGHYLLLGNGAAAVESYERGLGIQPRGELYFNLARALLFLGRRDEAVARAETAVALDPQFRDDAVDLGLRQPSPDDEDDEDDDRDGEGEREGRRDRRRELRRSVK